MEVQFSNDDLKRLEQEANFNGGFSRAIVRAFRKVLNFIRQAVDERDFRGMRSLNFEKLKGDRSHQYSMRLNEQWRLIIEIVPSAPKNVINIIAIEDYH
jgi:proteic killer suppression protein